MRGERKMEPTGIPGKPGEWTTKMGKIESYHQCPLSITTHLKSISKSYWQWLEALDQLINWSNVESKYNHCNTSPSRLSLHRCIILSSFPYIQAWASTATAKTAYEHQTFGTGHKSVIHKPMPPQSIPCQTFLRYEGWTAKQGFPRVQTQLRNQNLRIQWSEPPSLPNCGCDVQDVPWKEQQQQLHLTAHLGAIKCFSSIVLQTHTLKQSQESIFSSMKCVECFL